MLRQAIPAAYSSDLRERAYAFGGATPYAAYKAKQGSQRQLAQHFKVSELFVKEFYR